MSSTTKPSTCCGRSGEGCVCAAEAKCSCGQKSAGQCNCEKASTENAAISGKTCSCGQRAAGHCTCGRATESSNSGSKCSCGQRDKGACNCGGSNAPADAPENEIDFTTKK